MDVRASEELQVSATWERAVDWCAIEGLSRQKSSDVTLRNDGKRGRRSNTWERGREMEQIMTDERGW